MKRRIWLTCLTFLMMAFISGGNDCQPGNRQAEIGGSDSPEGKISNCKKAIARWTSQSKEYQIPPTLVVFISIESSNFNERDMTTLGKQLNKDFSLETATDCFYLQQLQRCEEVHTERRIVRLCEVVEGVSGQLSLGTVIRERKTLIFQRIQALRKLEEP